MSEATQPTRRTPLVVITVYENGIEGEKKTRIIKGRYLDSFGIDLTKPLDQIYRDLAKALPLWASNNLIKLHEQLSDNVDLTKIGVAYTTTSLIDEAVSDGKAAMTPIDQLGSNFDLTQIHSEFTGTAIIDIVADGHGSLGWITIEDHNPNNKAAIAKATGSALDQNF